MAFNHLLEDTNIDINILCYAILCYMSNANHPFLASEHLQIQGI